MSIRESGPGSTLEPTCVKAADIVTKATHTDGEPGCAAASTNSALEQIRSRDYDRMYLRQSGVRVFELGLVFSQSKRFLVQFTGTKRVWLCRFASGTGGQAGHRQLGSDLRAC